jgi:sRNA-binding protein
VKCRRGKRAKRLRKRFRRDRARLGERAAAELFGEQRSARDRRSASAAQETRFDDAVPLDAHRELQNVAAHRIADFHFGVRAGELASVAWILEMIENGVAKHQQEYSNGRLFFRRQVFFVNGGDDHVIGIDHFGEMEFADFGKQFVGVELG